VTRLAAALVLVFLSVEASGPEVELSLRLAEPLEVEVSLAGRGALVPREVLLYRSTSRLDEDPDTLALPVTVRRFPAPGEPGRAFALTDSMVAHNARYYYRARFVGPDGRSRWSSLDSVDTPDVALGAITGSSLLVDKLNYFLAVRDGGRTCKRYPVALGSQPRRRKLHQDNASTPEGIYLIAQEQPEARFHRAFDLDYPNPADRTRFEFWQRQGGEGRGIGGEVQIHGEGIARNWTHGCIALRNEDIDELFAHPRVGRGMPVHIVGSELTGADIQSILDYRPPAELRRIQGRLIELGFYDGKLDGAVGRGMRAALAGFQHRQGLAVTGQLDARTVAELGRDRPPD
jgi:lipoprotein-anchoring transpeptidase ErfK/SrfK